MDMSSQSSRSHDDFLAGSTESEKSEKNPVTGIPPSGLRGVMVMTGWFRATPMTSETSTSSCESRVPELWEAPNHPAFITMEIPTGNPIKNHHKSSIFSQQNPIEHLFMVIYWGFMGFHGVSWCFMGFHGVSWWFYGDFACFFQLQMGLFRNAAGRRRLRHLDRPSHGRSNNGWWSQAS